MTGIVNSTGAKSGIIGTTVGTPVTDLSTATFPAGHVIQTTAVTTGITKTIVTLDGDFASTVVTRTIEPIYDDSAIIAHVHFVTWIGGENYGDSGYSFRFLKTGTGVSTANPAGMDQDPTETGHAAMYRSPLQYTEWADIHSLSLMDEDCETTNLITYTLQAAEYNLDGAFNVGANTWYNFRWSIYLQEIKR